MLRGAGTPRSCGIPFWRDQVTNRELLQADGKTLSEVDRQRQYLLRVELMPVACPACLTTVDAISAAGIGIDDYRFGEVKHTYRCPHCQAEVPVVQDWVNGGGLPDDIQLISVSTAIDPNRPNYPPDAWLEREGWTAPVIVDESGAVADAYGLSAFPFWVFVNADGTVAGRMSGELTVPQLEQIIGVLQR